MFNLRKKATALSSTNTERFYKSKACSRAILISFILILTLGPAFTQIYAGHAASSKPKPPPPPPSNSTNWAKAYAFQYDYSSAYSVYVIQGQPLRPVTVMQRSSGSTHQETYKRRVSTPTRDTLKLPR
jgi:hypothetical protein